MEGKEGGRERRENLIQRTHTPHTLNINTTCCKMLPYGFCSKMCIRFHFTGPPVHPSAAGPCADSAYVGC